MSHTFITDPWAFNFDGDFEGEVRIRNQNTGNEFLIPAWALVEVVAQEYVLPRRVSQLENGDDDQILGLPKEPKHER